MFICSFILQNIFRCPFLTTKVSVLIPIVGGLLFLFVLLTLLRTSFTDPGIIPRATTEEAAYFEKQFGNLSYYIIISMIILLILQYQQYSPRSNE